MILIVGVLITVNAADARPAGTIIKEGVLTYPAVPYMTEDPLLNLESCGDDSKTQTSGNSLKNVCSGKEYLCFDNNNENIISGNLGDGNLWICKSYLLFNYYDFNTEILQPDFFSLLFNFYFPQPENFIHSIR